MSLPLAGAADTALVRQIDGVSAGGTMTIEVAQIKGKDPLLSSLEIIKQ